jgi:hypothetical protein
MILLAQADSLSRYQVVDTLSGVPHMYSGLI